MPLDNYRRDPRNILGRNEASELLEPFMDDLVLATRDGLAHFLAESATQMVPYRNRTKACMLNDAIVHNMKARLPESADVKHDESHDGTLIVIRNKLALRSKKLNKADRTSNVRTERQKRLDRQLEFTGIEGCTVVSLGYKLDAIWAEIIDIKIFCQVNGQRAWTIPLVPGSASPIFPISKDMFGEGGPQVRSSRPTDGSEETA